MAESKLIEHIKEERAFLHDISTPVMVIRLTTENMAMTDAVPEELKDKLERALRSVNAIADRIEERRSSIKNLQADLEDS